MISYFLRWILGMGKLYSNWMCRSETTKTDFRSDRYNEHTEHYSLFCFKVSIIDRNISNFHFSQIFLDVCFFFFFGLSILTSFRANLLRVRLLLLGLITLYIVRLSDTLKWRKTKESPAFYSICLSLFWPRRDGFHLLFFSINS